MLEVNALESLKRVNTELSKRVIADVDNYCATAYDGGHRKHLGASIIGSECKRYLWYTFRWCFSQQFDGRMQRLFNRGHREEARFIGWLRGSGFTVYDKETPDVFNEKGEVITEGKQFRVSDVMGHFGGSCDGVTYFPITYAIDMAVLLEFKTHGTGKNFQKLKDEGVQLSKFQHYAQMSVYGYKMNLSHALYMSINKNDDDIHVEVVELDHTLGKQMILRAEQIITSEIPPARISDNPTFFKCKFCPAYKLCHQGNTPERNCRSCVNAVPVDNAQWFCRLHNGVIPDNFIPTGCDFYKAITENV